VQAVTTGIFGSTFASLRLASAIKQPPSVVGLMKVAGK